MRKLIKRIKFELAWYWSMYIKKDSEWYSIDEELMNTMTDIAKEVFESHELASTTDYESFMHIILPAWKSMRRALRKSYKRGLWDMELEL